jgi:hypothetical protein
MTALTKPTPYVSYSELQFYKKDPHFLLPNRKSIATMPSEPPRGVLCMSQLNNKQRSVVGWNNTDLKL